MQYEFVKDHFEQILEHLWTRDENMKIAKIQTHVIQFETLKINEEKDNAIFFFHYI